jgi:hypothetical protein
MGFIRIMQSQQNPDGETAHIEREVLDLIRKAAPCKKRFAGNSGKYIKTMEFRAQGETLRVGEIRAMRKNCTFVAEYCVIARCWNCQRKRDLTTMQNKEIKRGLQLLERLLKGGDA